MVHNPITEEIRDIRHRLRLPNATTTSNASVPTFESLQAESGRHVVRLAKRTPSVATTNQATQRLARQRPAEVNTDRPPSADRVGN